TVEFIDDNFADANIGLIYNSGEANSVTQIENVNKAVKGTRLSTSERTVANSSEVQQAASTLSGDVDVMYIVTDNTVVSALDSVVDIAEEQEIPLIVGEIDSHEEGRLVNDGIYYHITGKRRREMNVEGLTEETEIENLDVEYPPEVQLYINKEASEVRGVEWDEIWYEEVELIDEDASFI